MNKIKTIIFIILFCSILSGCSTKNIRSALDIMPPKSNSLGIEGTWKIEKSKSIDGSTDDEQYMGKTVEISRNIIQFLGVEYKYPEYKLKIVNKNDINTYQGIDNLDKYFKSEKIQVYDITQSNNMICEFILYEEDKAIIYYYNNFLELKKISTDVSDNFDESDNLKNYDKEVGVMLGLKIPRDIQEGRMLDEYRTLWIAYKDNKLMPVVEKDNIILPRMNGMWEIKVFNYDKNGVHNEYFSANPAGEVKEKSILIDTKESVYKTINFVGNDYISIEKFQGNNFTGIYNEYQMVPIDNINTDNSIYINDIYDKEGIERYNDEYKSILKNIPDEERIYYNELPNYKNFGVKRKDGKWNIVGRISSNNLNYSNYDFNFSMKPNKKLLNYDVLSIPWEVLKNNKPYIKDAFISPNDNIGIIIEENKLSIYEISSNLLGNSPIAVIELNDEEQVIMAEWCTVGYVDKWAKVFSDGIVITE